jgi:hypothetical protein
VPVFDPDSATPSLYHFRLYVGDGKELDWSEIEPAPHITVLVPDKVAVGEDGIFPTAIAIAELALLTQPLVK